MAKRTAAYFESGTPVVYDGDSGEVVTRKGKKAISLYPDSNYAGSAERIITPTWSKVKTFDEANRSSKRKTKKSKSTTMPKYSKTHKSKKAADSHERKIKARGGKVTRKGNKLDYHFPK